MRNRIDYVFDNCKYFKVKLIKLKLKKKRNMFNVYTY